MQRPLHELFVNRDRQLDAFRRMMDGAGSRRVMIITAEAGTGKSWTLQMFAHQAGLRDLPVVLIDFADGQAYDALLLARRCRDAFGPQYFNTFTRAINEATTARVSLALDGTGGQPVDVRVDGHISDSSVAISEVGTIIKDNYFTVQADNLLIRQVMEDRINGAFFESLAELEQQQRVVFLFDTYERNSLDPHRWMPNAADRWIVEQLLTRIRDGRLENTIVVLAGQRTPEFGAEWNAVLGRMPLHPLECVDVKEYLRERRGLADITDAEAERLCQAVAGSPQILGLIGDNLVQANQPQLVDDEW